MTKRKFPNPMGKNQYTAKKLEWKGEMLTIKELAGNAGISPQAMHRRLERGWTLEKAMTTPVVQANKQDELPPIHIFPARIEGLRMSFS